MIRRPRRFWPLYVGWILVCAALFAALSVAEDPSRPEGKVLSIEAAAAGLRAARAADPVRFRDYRVVHVARARAGEGSDRARWLVLLDREPRTRLRDAVVVEIGEEDGRVLRIRRPVPAIRR